MPDALAVRVCTVKRDTFSLARAVDRELEANGVPLEARPRCPGVIEATLGDLDRAVEGSLRRRSCSESRLPRARLVDLSVGRS